MRSHSRESPVPPNSKPKETEPTVRLGTSTVSPKHYTIIAILILIIVIVIVIVSSCHRVVASSASSSSSPSPAAAAAAKAMTIPSASTPLTILCFSATGRTTNIKTITTTRTGKFCPLGCVEQNQKFKISRIGSLIATQVWDLVPEPASMYGKMCCNRMIFQNTTEAPEPIPRASEAKPPNLNP